ncbi:SMI1/KNR4 family protein [Tabrizicola aquatica]|uniref:SMI1/KNR4 family protein n=1 Tax=Tabrizicola aquatica TaxID=909926 RepID=UPI0015E1A367|nr:SMI1/KNR4 family protein [Tabrizicola aquatica]
MEKLFALNVPATTDSVREAETQLAMPLPQDYKEFLSISNGLTTNRLVLLEAEDIASRNKVGYGAQAAFTDHSKPGGYERTARQSARGDCCDRASIQSCRYQEHPGQFN